MSLRAVTFFTYRTQGGSRPWSNDELGVLRFVEALKGKTLKNRQTVKINGESRHLGGSRTHTRQWTGYQNRRQ